MDEWYVLLLDATNRKLIISTPGAERICLERIQIALKEFIDYKKRKEEEKKNANRTS